MSEDYELSRNELELAFWRRRTELLEVARTERARVLAQHELADATGIIDRGQLDDLIAADVTPKTSAALGIVPLVCVAWASGVVHPKERAVALAAAVAAGVSEDSEPFAMFASWLEVQPDVDLLGIWGTYVRALKLRVPFGTYHELRANLLERARKIGEAAGGPGDRGEITETEAAVIERIRVLLG